jgi:CO/xanthine dehydrogenase Mo-binding subunit
MFTDLKHLGGRSGTNVALDARVRRGDIAKGFAESDHVFEHTFRTGKVIHATFEPMVSLAEKTGQGLTIHTASQSPSFVRAEVSRLLGWAENQVRVRTAYLGGGFGAKLYIKLEALVACAHCWSASPCASRSRWTSSSIRSPSMARRCASRPA